MNSEIKLMLNAAQIAGRIFSEKKDKVLYRHKSPRDIVTNCDVQIENTLYDYFAKEDKDSVVYGEETGEKIFQNRKVWVIDPIDGTHNFAFNVPIFGVCIALIEDGNVTNGLIHLPESNDNYYASVSKGAYRNDEKILVSKKNTLSRSMIAYDNQFTYSNIVFDNFKKLSELSFTMRIFGAASFDLCSVARGCYEARIFHNTKPVDVCAGSLIVCEAGGKATNFSGDPFRFNTTDLIVSNGHIHDEILENLTSPL